MTPLAAQPSGAYLDRIANHLERLQQMNRSDPAGREQALVASRKILGMLALYRGMLGKAAAQPAHTLTPRTLRRTA